MRFELLIDKTAGLPELADSRGRVYLDTYDNESVSLNYNIADLTSLGDKKSSYSKTIKLPDTKRNRYAFYNIFNIERDFELTENLIGNPNLISYYQGLSFNPNKKVKCYILKDSLIIFEGNLQLTSISYDYENGSGFYEVVIYADNDTLFKTMGDKFLSSLDLSRYDHQLTANNVLKSWTASATNGYFYPMIEYGFPLTKDRAFRAYDFYPAMYAKVLWDQIFTEAGYSYVSTFLEQEPFTRLILPYMGGNMTGVLAGLTISSSGALVEYGETQSNTYQLDKWSSSGPTFPGFKKTGIGNWTYSYYAGADVTKNIVFWLPLQATYSYDPNGLYNNSTLKYKNPTNQRFGLRFRITLDIESKLTYDNSGIGPANPQWGGKGNNPLFLTPVDDIRIYIKRQVSPTGASVSITKDATQYNIFQFVLIDDFTTGTKYPDVTFGGERFYSVRNNPQGLEVTDDGAGKYRYKGTIVSDYIVDPLTIREGEELIVFITRYEVPQIRNTGDAQRLNQVYMKSQNVKVEVIPDNTINTEGGYIAISKILPNMKQKDFITGIIKMFNLYLEPAKELANTFVIEPRDIYYQTQVIKDWTSKIDLSKEISSDISSNKQKKTQVFTYKEDKDFYNTLFKQNTGDIYGNFRYDYDNDFTTDTAKIELVFSPTINRQLPGSNVIYIPQIFSQNGTNLSVLTGGQPRILYSKGVTLSSVESIKFWTKGFNIGTTSNINIYPYASATDEPLTPTFTLNFGESDNFIQGYTETTNTLYNNYYYNAVEQLNNVDSRIVQASFYLTSADINSFRFNDLIYCSIGGMSSYWRVSKIMDYDPGLNTSTKVELITAFDYGQNQWENVIEDLQPLRARTPVSADGFIPPQVKDQVYVGVLNTSFDNKVFSPNVMVMGENNRVYGENNIVIGKNNENVVGSFNFVMGSSISSVFDTTDNPSVLIGNNISNNTIGSFIFGNNVTLSFPNETIVGTGSSSSLTNDVTQLPTNLFVVGNDLTLNGSLPNNTTFLGTENIILAESGGFNTPFIISEAVSTTLDPTGQNIIKTITGKAGPIVAGDQYINLTQYIVNDFSFVSQSTISIEAYVKIHSTPNMLPPNIPESAVDKLYGVFTYKNTYGLGFEQLGTTDIVRKDNFTYSTTGAIITDLVVSGPYGQPAYDDGISLYLVSGDDICSFSWDLTLRYRYQ